MTPARATLQTIPGRVFSADEGAALQVLEALLGRGRGDAVTVPVRLAPLAGDLAAAGARGGPAGR